MSILRTILFPQGSRLEIHTDGKKRYIPSQAYFKKRQEFMRKPEFQHIPAYKRDSENCFRLLARLFGYSVAETITPFKEEVRKEASPYMSIWKD